MLSALVISAVFVSSNERFQRFGCDEQETANGIVRILSWKLWDELLTLEIERLASGSENVDRLPVEVQIIHLQCKQFSSAYARHSSDCEHRAKGLFGCEYDSFYVCGGLAGNCFRQSSYKPLQHLQSQYL